MKFATKLYVSMCVCLRVCMSIAACPHYCTDPDVTWGNGRGCTLVVHYWADLQSLHGFRCYDNIARTRNVSECLYSPYAWLIHWSLYVQRIRPVRFSASPWSLETQTLLDTWPGDVSLYYHWDPSYTFEMCTTVGADSVRYPVPLTLPTTNVDAIHFAQTVGPFFGYVVNTKT